jgi:hypothetical protein
MVGRNAEFSRVHKLENSHTALGICGIAYSEYCCASVAGKGEFKDTKLIWKGDRW